MTLPKIGIEFQASHLTWVRSIEEFEGPILSEFRDEDGTAYLEKWCTKDATASRSLRVATRQRAIAEYIAGHWSLLDLVTRPNQNIGVLVDTALIDGRITRASLVDVRALPEEYLPEADAMYDDTLRPRTGLVREMFMLDPDWTGTKIARIERAYKEVAAFAYCTGPAKVRMPPFRYDGGYVYATAFRAIQDSVPKPARAKSATVEANSPGVLAIDAPAATAEAVQNVLRRATAHDAQLLYDQLHRWSKLKYSHTDKIPSSAERDLADFCRALDVEVDSVMPRNPDPDEARDLLTAGKLVAAYYRRIWQVLSPDGAELVIRDMPKVEAPDSLSFDEDDDEIPF